MMTVRNSVFNVALVPLIAISVSCEDQAAPTAPSLAGDHLLDSTIEIPPNSSTRNSVDRSQALPNRLSTDSSLQTADGSLLLDGLTSGPVGITLEAGSSPTLNLPGPEHSGPSAASSTSQPLADSAPRLLINGTSDFSSDTASLSSNNDSSLAPPTQIDEPQVTVSSAQTATDGSTLKVNAVVLLSPVGDAQTEDLTPILTVTNAQALFIPQELLAARGDVYVLFELSKVRDNGSTETVHTNQTLQTTETTSYEVSVTLEETTTYRWRAQAKIGDAKGPWSTTATFVTPTLVKIGVPTPLLPANGDTVSTQYPELIAANPEVIGLNVSDVVIEFRLDDESSLFPNPVTFEEPMTSGNTTADAFKDSLALSTQFWWGVRARSAAAGLTSAWSETYTFSTGSASAGPRTSDPAPGQKLPLPNQLALMTQLAQANPGLLANSCQEEGGPWDYMELAVEKLRETDSRWGY
ncbi:MAG: hypothetical protein VX453_09430, partial [Acidobacteriota bacterium]|nr:hypothetical protein [Acidobacteriota bacterium]